MISGTNLDTSIKFTGGTSLTPLNFLLDMFILSYCVLTLTILFDTSAFSSPFQKLSYVNEVNLESLS